MHNQPSGHLRGVWDLRQLPIRHVSLSRSSESVCQTTSRFRPWRKQEMLPERGGLSSSTGGKFETLLLSARSQHEHTFANGEDEHIFWGLKGASNVARGGIFFMGSQVMLFKLPVEETKRSVTDTTALPRICVTHHAWIRHQDSNDCVMVYWFTPSLISC